MCPLYFSIFSSDYINQRDNWHIHSNLHPFWQPVQQSTHWIAHRWFEVERENTHFNRMLQLTESLHTFILPFARVLFEFMQASPQNLRLMFDGEYTVDSTTNTLAHTQTYKQLVIQHI